MKKIISCLVVFAFMVNSVCYGLAPVAGSLVEDTRTAMRAMADREYLAEKGFGFAKGMEFFEELSYVTSNFKVLPPNNGEEVKIKNWIDVSKSGYPEEMIKGRFFEVLKNEEGGLRGVDIVRAFKLYINIYGNIPMDKIFIETGILLDENGKRNNKAINAAEISIDKTPKGEIDKVILTLDEEYLEGLYEDRNNDKVIYKLVKGEGAQNDEYRYISLFWGRFFNLAMHEVTRISKKTNESANGYYAHVTREGKGEIQINKKEYVREPKKGDGPNDRTKMNSLHIGRRYHLDLKAIKLWEVTSRCMPENFPTKQYNSYFNARAAWLLNTSKWRDEFKAKGYESPGDLAKEWEHLEEWEKMYVLNIASQINYEKDIAVVSPADQDSHPGVKKRPYVEYAEFSIPKNPNIGEIRVWKDKATENKCIVFQYQPVNKQGSKKGRWEALKNSDGTDFSFQLSNGDITSIDQMKGIIYLEEYSDDIRDLGVRSYDRFVDVKESSNYVVPEEGEVVTSDKIRKMLDNYESVIKYDLGNREYDGNLRARQEIDRNNTQKPYTIYVEQFSEESGNWEYVDKKLTSSNSYSFSDMLGTLHYFSESEQQVRVDYSGRINLNARPSAIKRAYENKTNLMVDASVSCIDALAKAEPEVEIEKYDKELVGKILSMNNIAELDQKQIWKIVIALLDFLEAKETENKNFDDIRGLVLALYSTLPEGVYKDDLFGFVFIGLKMPFNNRIVVGRYGGSREARLKAKEELEKKQQELNRKYLPANPIEIAKAAEAIKLLPKKCKEETRLKKLRELMHILRYSGYHEKQKEYIAAAIKFATGLNVTENRELVYGVLDALVREYDVKSPEPKKDLKSLFDSLSDSYKNEGIYAYRYKVFVNEWEELKSYKEKGDNRIVTVQRKIGRMIRILNALSFDYKVKCFPILKAMFNFYTEPLTRTSINELNIFSKNLREELAKREEDVNNILELIDMLKTKTTTKTTTREVVGRANSDNKGKRTNQLVAELLNKAEHPTFLTRGLPRIGDIHVEKEDSELIFMIYTNDGWKKLTDEDMYYNVGEVEMFTQQREEVLVTYSTGKATYKFDHLIRERVKENDAEYDKRMNRLAKYEALNEALDILLAIEDWQQYQRLTSDLDRVLLLILNEDFTRSEKEKLTSKAVEIAIKFKITKTKVPNDNARTEKEKAVNEKNLAHNAVIGNIHSMLQSLRKSPGMQKSIYDWAEATNKQKSREVVGRSNGTDVSEEQETIRETYKYILGLGSDMGPASRSEDKPLSDIEQTAMDTLIGQMDAKQIHIFIANDPGDGVAQEKLSDDMDKAIKSVNKNIENRGGIGKLYVEIQTPERILARMEDGKRDKDRKYIVIASGKELEAFNKAVNEKDDNAYRMRDVRLINMQMPDAEISSEAGFTYRVKAIFVATMARLVDGKNKMMLDQLKDYITPMAEEATETEINEMIKNLITDDSEDMEKVKTRIENTVKGVSLKLINTLREQLHILKRFAVMA
ncbi:MAG: hypothetical protein HQL29_01790 [Candidatus Omnitrophica bacterium]|nr:hypothetical protein [Candidatus Omnitrophota bacterium]